MTDDDEALSDEDFLALLKYIGAHAHENLPVEEHKRRFFGGRFGDDIPPATALATS